MAVKPQVLADVCAPLSAVDFSDKLLISIAAGISVARLIALLPTAQAVVRVMPNTPALVGEGMAGLFAAKKHLRKRPHFCAGFVVRRRQNPLGSIRRTHACGYSRVWQ